MTSELDNVVRSDVDEPPQRRATLLFVRMWAIAHILHLLIANHTALDTPWNIAVVSLALAVLLQPAAGRWVAAMMVAQLVEYAVEMPFSPDHWALVAFVNMAVLITMAVSRTTDVSALEKALPAARALLLVAYGAAALSKWNSSFLDPVTSCATAIARVVSFGLAEPFADSHLLSLGAAVTETLVFLLLAVRATRTWGVMLGLVFHLSLSASPVMVVGDFTSTVYALFFLFLRPEHTARVLKRTRMWAGRSGIVRDARRRPRVTAALALTVLGFGGYVAVPVAMAVLYVLEQSYFVSLVLATALTLRAARRRERLGKIRLYHLPVLLLAVAWAMNPYLGLRTTGSFTMFSNLRTESPAPNHLFMPVWRVTDWQDDMVRLKGSTTGDLQTGADNHLAVPLVALRRMATDDPDLQVTGVLHGIRTTWGPEPGQETLEPLPWWQYKLFLLRPVVTDASPFCAQS